MDANSWHKQGVKFFLKDTQHHDDVSLENELALGWAMYVSDHTVGRFVNKRRTSYVVPHLAGSHGKCEKL